MDLKETVGKHITSHASHDIPGTLKLSDFQVHCHPLFQQTRGYRHLENVTPGRALAWNGLLAKNGGYCLRVGGLAVPQYIRTDVHGS